MSQSQLVELPQSDVPRGGFLSRGKAGWSVEGSTNRANHIRDTQPGCGARVSHCHRHRLVDEVEPHALLHRAPDPSAGAAVEDRVTGLEEAVDSLESSNNGRLGPLYHGEAVELL